NDDAKIASSTMSFFGRGPNLGPITFLTDDSNSERNALGHCWQNSNRLLCVFHVLQAFWHWLHNSKHNINKDHKRPIMNIMKKILYSHTEDEMVKYYNDLKINYYNIYPQLQRHFE
ncbi:29419_t:CDS:1, partial [Gigaspora margarita]